MGKKVNKWLKIALCMAGLAALLVLSGILGTRIERNRQHALELQKEHVSTIAVVNMDNGAVVGNEHINYASQLMSFPNDHFLVTGLTDAKAGIENGIYAAYVVIPETFSVSVTSIENDPQKVTLVYQYNNKLVEEAEIQAINDINAFVVLLNSNIAYMYMDAIMTEFHRIQDDSSTILANDNMELELLANVNTAQLIAIAEPVEEIAVNNEIQPLQLAAYVARNNSLLDLLLLSYSEAVRKGKDDYMAIQEENTEVAVAADSFLLAYDTVIRDTVAEQSQFLATGRDKLAEAVGSYNRNVDAQEEELRSIIADIINMQLEADRNLAKIQLQQIIEEIEASDEEALKDLQEQWEKAYQDLQDQCEKEYQDLQDEWEKACQDLQEAQDLQEQWKKAYQDLQDEWEKACQDLQGVQDLQARWKKAYQELQSEADNYLLQNTEVCRSNLEELVRNVYIQGYNKALDDLTGQIDSMKDGDDSENVAISVLQAFMEENRLSEPLAPETETYLEDFKADVNEQLSNISIDWNQLNVSLPEISENGPEIGGEENGGEETGGEETGGEETGGGETGGGEETGGEGIGGERIRSKETDGEETGADTEPDKAPEKEFEISLTAFNDEETIGNTVREILELFKLEAESEQINEVIQTYFVDALSAESERQMVRLSDAKSMLSQSMEEYENRLVNYDPLQYIESANLKTYLNDIEVNTGEMLDTVEQNNSDYMLYATEMYTNATEHTTKIRSSLNEANTRTAENVKGCIDDLVLSRAEVNSQNVDLLEGFINSLRYTRVGSQGNAEIYDYIVNPVVSRINGQAVTNTAEPVSEKGNPIKIWLVVVLGSAIILCLAEVISNLRRQRKKPVEENEDVF